MNEKFEKIVAKIQDMEADELQEICRTLTGIIFYDLESNSDVWDVFKKIVRSEKNDFDSLCCAYETLGGIVKEQPELGADVSDIFKEAVRSEKNDEDTLRYAYETLGDVVKERPELSADVLGVLKETIRSEENDSDSLRYAYETLGDIVKERPDLSIDVLGVLKETIRSEENDSYSLRYAYETLGNIVKERPEVSGDVVELINNWQIESSLSKFKLLAVCMKSNRPDEFIGLSSEQQTELVAAYNMRYSLPDEIEYAFCELGIEEISGMHFSAQQRCLSLMIGELGKASTPPQRNLTWRKNAEDEPLYSDNKDWLIEASFKAAKVFGCYFPSYLKRTEKYLSVHDAVYWLPKNLGASKKESFMSFVQKNLIYADMDGQKRARPLAEMEVIAKNWKYLKSEDEKLKYKDVLALCQSRKYDDQEYDKFAVEAARWGVAEEQYKEFESIYKAGLKVPEPFDSSREFKFGKYKGRFLPRNDVRTGFFGGYTDCCQHFDGVGRSCAVSTVKDPYSQLFVIENQEGRIIAGSWVWENTEGKYREACFDNIEAIGEYAQNPVINKIYEMAGQYLTQETNCRRVTIGLGYQDADVSKYKKTKAVPLPEQYHDGYSDAKGTQVLLAENRNAKPLDKSKESQRFIRDVCCLEVDDRDRVSEQCFPDGDQQLQIPDEMSGLVVVDADKGVVGYCLYDKNEKSIYDMAVLPEYRTDENASSRRLFAEMIRRVKKIGGEWSAELRDKTTYRYLKVMAERGMVSFENHGVDHKMSDGSKVYQVSFSVNQSQGEKSLLQQKGNTR